MDGLNIEKTIVSVYWEKRLLLSSCVVGPRLWVIAL